MITIKGLKLENGKVTQEFFEVSDVDTIVEALDAVEEFISEEVLTYGNSDKWSLTVF